MSFFCEIAQDELAVYQEQFFFRMFGDEVLHKLPSILGILHEKNSMMFGIIQFWIELYTENTITAHISRVNEPQFGHGC